MRQIRIPVCPAPQPATSHFIRLYAERVLRPRTRAEQAADRVWQASARQFYAPPTGRPRLVTSVPANTR